MCRGGRDRGGARSRPDPVGAGGEEDARGLLRRKLGELAPAGLETLRPGEARGVLLGGTVTQLLASLGTPYAFSPPPGFVLLFEEVGERPYRLDRMVTLMTGAESIRDVIAFPKTQRAQCLLTQAPNTVDEMQLRELHIRLRQEAPKA